MRITRIILVCALALSACVDPSADLGSDDAELVGRATLTIEDGSPEGIGFLALLNDKNTTLEILDDDVRLNARAAKNIIHHRDGYDRVAGTSDDNPFDSIDEVDGVSWVGPSAMQRILDFALANGWVPAGDEQLGRWDGVSFTVAEAHATLEFTNRASHDLLDHDMKMDRRTADSIVNAQPIGSIEELAGLFYVGKSALQQLKAAAEVPDVPETDFRDQFNHDEALEIPDGDWYGIETYVSVSGVPVDRAVGIYLVVDIRHDNPSEVEFELTSPDGDSWETQADGSLVKLPLGSVLDPNGRWRLRVYDGRDGNAGEQYGWALEIATDKTHQSSSDRFAIDLAWWLGHWYRSYGEDAVRGGGNTLEEARAAIRAGSVTEVTDPNEDPEGYDLEHVLVLRHEDVVFPGSDRVWFAAYDRETGGLNDVYSFE